VTFGEDNQGNELSTTEMLMWYGDWIKGPSLPTEYRRQDHCSVQINSCEIAIIGGFRDDGVAGLTLLDDILIYNFEDGRWKKGPMCVYSISNQIVDDFYLRAKPHALFTFDHFLPS
jgi:hypothetical protein